MSNMIFNREQRTAKGGFLAKLAGWLGSGALVAGLNGLNIVAAFGAQMLIYSLLGPSRDTDIYFAATAIPQMLATVLATTAAGALVPLMARHDGEQQARLCWLLLMVVGLFSAAAAAVLVISAPTWVPKVFSGFAGADAQRCLTLVQIQIAALPFIAATSILTATHHARSQFARVEMVNLAMALGMIGSLWLGLPRLGIVAASGTFTARFLLQALVMLRGMGRPRWAGTGTGARSAWHSARVLLAGNLYFKTDILVDRHLLSMAAPGSLSLVSLAQTIYSALSAVIGQAWGNTAVPLLSACYRDGNRSGFQALYRERLLKIALIAGVFLVLVILCRPVLTLFQGPRFTAESAAQLWTVLLLMAGILIFGSLGSVVAGCFYAVGDTRTPTYLSAFTFTAIIALKLIFFKHFGVVLLCLLTSLHYAVNVIVMMGLLPQTLKSRFPA